MAFVVYFLCKVEKENIFVLLFILFLKPAQPNKDKDINLNLNTFENKFYSGGIYNWVADPRGVDPDLQIISVYNRRKTNRIRIQPNMIYLKYVSGTDQNTRIKNSVYRH